MKISDRALGYLSIILLLLIFAVVAYCMATAQDKATTTAIVDFNELGTLQPEDQVVIRGYTVGTVGTVTWLGDRARVQIKFDEPVVIREGTQFNNVNYAIMGQRRLEIVPSKTGAVLPEDYVHTGNFEPGIAEVLRYIENVNDQIEVVRNTVLMVVKGDSTHKSATELFENAMSTIEATIQNTENLVNKLQPAINNVFAQVDSASNTLINVTYQADTAIKVASDAVNEKLAMADSAIKAISDGANSANETISKIESTALENKLLTSTETVDKLETLSQKLSALVKAINTRGIKMYDENGNRVKLFTWKNLNLVGKTAREKARIREEEAKKNGPKE